MQLNHRGRRLYQLVDDVGAQLVGYYEKKSNEVSLFRNNGDIYIIRSALSRSPSLIIVSISMLVVGAFFAFKLAFTFAIRLCSSAILRGRGGTAGFCGTVLTVLVGDSSELDSSWAADAMLTAMEERVVQEFGIRFQVLIESLPLL